jgi:hypothetical protein
MQHFASKGTEGQAEKRGQVEGMGMREVFVSGFVTAAELN